VGSLHVQAPPLALPKPGAHLRLVRPACSEARAGVQRSSWSCSRHQSRLGPAAKPILPLFTRVARGSDSRTRGPAHAQTFTRSLTHTHSPGAQNRPVPGRVARWGCARPSAGAPLGPLGRKPRPTLTSALAATTVFPHPPGSPLRAHGEARRPMRSSSAPDAAVPRPAPRAGEEERRVRRDPASSRAVSSPTSAAASEIQSN
jgi:hypothetical protein